MAKNPAGVKLMAETTPESVVREIWLHPAWDMRNEPDGNFGVHGAELVFVVKHNKCGVTWRLMTNWYLKNVRQDWERKGNQMNYWYDGLGTVDWHSPVPLSESEYDQEPSTEHCDYTGGKCYSVGSGSDSQDLFDEVISGTEEIWPALQLRLFGLEERVAKAQVQARVKATLQNGLAPSDDPVL